MAFPPREAYERLIYSLPDTYPEVQSSSLHLYSNSPTTALVRGSVWFRSGLELRVFEYVDFSDGELLDYFTQSTRVKNVFAGTILSLIQKSPNWRALFRTTNTSRPTSSTTVNPRRVSVSPYPISPR